MVFTRAMASTLPHSHAVVSTGMDSPVCSSGERETYHGGWQDSVGRCAEADLSHFHTAVSLTMSPFSHTSLFVTGVLQGIVWYFNTCV